MPADVGLAQAHRFMNEGFRKLWAMRGVHETGSGKFLLGYELRHAASTISTSSRP